MEVEKISPLSVVDYVLDQLSVPQLDPLLKRVAPKNVVGNVLGLRTLGDIGSEILARVDTQVRRL